MLSQQKQLLHPNNLFPNNCTFAIHENRIRDLDSDQAFVILRKVIVEDNSTTQIF